MKKTSFEGNKIAGVATGFSFPFHVVIKLQSCTLGYQEKEKGEIR